MQPQTQSPQILQCKLSSVAAAGRSHHQDRTVHGTGADFLHSFGRTLSSTSINKCQFAKARNIGIAKARVFCIWLSNVRHRFCAAAMRIAAPTTHQSISQGAHPLNKRLYRRHLVETQWQAS